MDFGKLVSKSIPLSTRSPAG